MIGNIVRNRRKQLGWTQKELAEKSGVAQAQISRLEAGKSYNVTIDSLRNLAWAFGCSVIDLLPEEDQRPLSGKRRLSRKEAELLSIKALDKRISEIEKRLKGQA
ncbi:helix-turn-helix domain-containing protein [Nitrosococcus watsonii]|uniref:Transcriptional regulator, XRE family n=1 Tax=Nitrosococcus watsoni (strain C-113) TaxID=105559 RepID=D8KCD2_NITWC|nr:helix-turn-helix transcriptional regulator [Nitrosococcus watsonii]ADJ29873.1 transcriptional regulator, XRE family [Nitrosococcus watsonii C-113]